MTKQPNILWLVLDCARYDRIGAHGYERPTTPTLDRLISEGLDFQRAYAPSIWSLPCYTSLLTGLYPKQHGVTMSGRALPTEVPTLAQQLQTVGYTTACFSNNGWLEPTFGLHTGFDHFERLWFSAQKSLPNKIEFLSDRLLGRVQGKEDKGAGRTNRKLVRWLTSQNTPTFAFVAYMEPHTPYTNHRRLHSVFGNHVDLRVAQSFYPYEWVEQWPEPYHFSPELLDALHRSYDLEMRYIDEMVGNLLEELADAHLLDETIVIITADHGEMLGEHNLFGHQFSVAEPLRHVPLIVWGPHIWQQSAVIEDLVQTVDLPATLCEWCGVEWTGSTEKHILPERNGVGTREYTITDYAEPHVDAVQRRYPTTDLGTLAFGLTCASDAQHKVVHRSDGTWCGYDLKADPAEVHALPITDHASLHELQSKLQSYLSQTSAMPNGQEDIPQEVREHLRALGYLE